MAEREKLLEQQDFPSMLPGYDDTEFDTERLDEVSSPDIIEDIIEDTEEEDVSEDDEEGYEIPIGPLPQMIFNDLKSLDEMVSRNIHTKSGNHLQ